MKLPDGTEVGYVYGLFDPRDGKCYYVGETNGPLEKRRGLHIATALGAFDSNDGSTLKKNVELRDWISSLLTDNNTPRISLLEEVPQSGDAKADKRARWDAEKSWRKRLLDARHPLLNRVPGIRKGKRFADGTGPRKLKGRKRPELAAKLMGRTLSDEHRESLSGGQAGRVQRLKESGEWDSPEQRSIRSDKVRAAWATRRLTPESDGTRERRRQGQLRRRGKLPSAS